MEIVSAPLHWGGHGAAPGTEASELKVTIREWSIYLACNAVDRVGIVEAARQ
jgi:hypothetical protein